MEEVKLEKPVEPTYRMRPYDEAKFSPSAVRKIADEVCKAVLDGKKWNGEEEPVWAVQITEQVKARVRALNFARYKLVVQTVLGQHKQQGVRVASRCLWDTEVDNFASASYQNESLWATVMVFGLYTE